MMRSITTHWLLQVIAHRAQAKDWIRSGRSKPSDCVATRRQCAEYARDQLRYARRSAENFVNRIKILRWLDRRELESGVAV